MRPSHPRKVLIGANTRLRVMIPFGRKKKHFIAFSTCSLDNLLLSSTCISSVTQETKVSSLYSCFLRNMLGCLPVFRHQIPTRSRIEILLHYLFANIIIFIGAKIIFLKELSIECCISFLQKRSLSRSWCSYLLRWMLFLVPMS